MASAEELEDVERWFLRRGIPHFIADYSASRDVFTRLIGPLVLVVFVEVAFAARDEWPVWAKVLTALVGFVVVLVGWATANNARGRALMARPDNIGPVEVGAFIVLPAMLPLVFGGQAADAAVLAVGNAALLCAIYLGTSYGVLPMLRWALGRAVAQVGALGGLLARALPLLLLFVTFLFVNPDVWQVSASLGAGGIAGAAAFFAVVATAFVVGRMPREVEGLSQFASWDDVRDRVSGTPAASLLPARKRTGAPQSPPLSRRQWGNVGLVILFSQAVQVLLVSALIFAFFVAFGVVAITGETTTAWTGDPEQLLAFTVGGRELLLTGQLLRVSAFLAAFSGLYFTVYALTDETYRQEFYEDVVGEVRQAFAVRAAYEAARAKS